MYKLRNQYRESRLYPIIRGFSRTIEKGVKRILNVNRFKSGRVAIQKYKNFYDGQRCFIIGNGPSLTIKDLEKLKEFGEISIASNSIYNLFPNTEWRPTIYTVHDFQEIKKTREKISAVKTELKIVAMSASGRIYNIDEAILLRLIEPKRGGYFSDDISKCVYDGGTVTYVSLQCAVYMGFKEIILLGVDHSFAREQTKDGKMIINNKIKNHFQDYQTDDFWGNGQKDEEAVVFPLDFATDAFITARHYADEHGVRILNATRGGKLEVFERVDFDTLFSKK
ncbi:MAG: DUF115 domain-containing protein [Synergistaceae bacterium]|nr:DUF115 domain-containing protein [Synergistaceae bacterium]